MSKYDKTCDIVLIARSKFMVICVVNTDLKMDEKNKHITQYDFFSC